MLRGKEMSVESDYQTTMGFLHVAYGQSQAFKGRGFKDLYSGFCKGFFWYEVGIDDIDGGGSHRIKRHGELYRHL